MRKYVIGVILALFLISPVWGEETRSGVYLFDLTISGEMNAGSGTSFLQVDSKSYNETGYPLNLDMIKPNLGVFSIQVYQINGGSLTDAEGEFLTSGVTYTLDYSTSIKKDVWSSGTTRITLTALSGQTTEVIPFTPEFARFYRFRITSGITQIGIFKAKLLIQ